jgi:drug/metabolite transporter (DMT)-like permease
MGLPRQLPPSGSGSGRGPFGEKAFRGALLGCAVVLLVGVLMVLLGGDAPKSVGAAFIVLALVGLATAAAGLLVERLLGRRPPPPQAVSQQNGRGRRPPRRQRRRPWTR